MSTTRSSDGVYASVGAVRQSGGKLPIYVCDDCGRDVVWAESKRTGRKYLANVSSGYNGARFYIGANIHHCDRSRTPEARLAREIENEIKNAEKYTLDQMFAVKDAALDAGDRETALAAGAAIRAFAAEMLK